MSTPIESVTIRFKDGSVRRINVDTGEGIFTENRYVGTKKSFTTYSIFIAEGNLVDYSFGNK
jgi:hypothetical protein